MDCLPYTGLKSPQVKRIETRNMLESGNYVFSVSFHSTSAKYQEREFKADFSPLIPLVNTNYR